MFDKIKNFFRKNGSKKREKNYSFSPGRDWKVVFFIFLVVNLAVFLYLVSFYLRILKKEDLKGVSLPTETEFIDEPALEQVLELYSKRGERLDELLKSAPDTKDPSL